MRNTIHLAALLLASSGSAIPLQGRSEAACNAAECKGHHASHSSQFKLEKRHETIVEYETYTTDYLVTSRIPSTRVITRTLTKETGPTGSVSRAVPAATGKSPTIKLPGTSGEPSKDLPQLPNNVIPQVPTKSLGPQLSVPTLDGAQILPLPHLSIPNVIPGSGQLTHPLIPELLPTEVPQLPKSNPATDASSPHLSIPFLGDLPSLSVPHLVVPEFGQLPHTSLPGTSLPGSPQPTKALTQPGLALPTGAADLTKSLPNPGLPHLSIPTLGAGLPGNGFPTLGHTELPHVTIPVVGGSKGTPDVTGAPQMSLPSTGSPQKPGAPEISLPFKNPTFAIPTFEIPTFAVPTFSIPSFSMPTGGIGAPGLPQHSLPNNLPIFTLPQPNFPTISIPNGLPGFTIPIPGKSITTTTSSSTVKVPPTTTEASTTTHIPIPTTTPKLETTPNISIPTTPVETTPKLDTTTKIFTTPQTTTSTTSAISTPKIETTTKALTTPSIPVSHLTTPVVSTPKLETTTKTFTTPSFLTTPVLSTPDIETTTPKIKTTTQKTSETTEPTTATTQHQTTTTSAAGQTATTTVSTTEKSTTDITTSSSATSSGTSGTQRSSTTSTVSSPTASCPQPGKNDTDTAFKENPEYADLANSAETPSGFDQSFENMNTVAIGSSKPVISIDTISSYDPATCAAVCKRDSDCQAFNIFIERMPQVSPSDDCPNPASEPAYRCVSFSKPICPSDAVNDGQYRNDFHVVEAASNGYNLKGAGGCSMPNKVSSTTTLTVVSTTSQDDPISASTTTMLSTPVGSETTAPSTTSTSHDTTMPTLIRLSTTGKALATPNSSLTVDPTKPTIIVVPTTTVVTIPTTTKKGKKHHTKKSKSHHHSHIMTATLSSMVVVLPDGKPLTTMVPVPVPTATTTKKGKKHHTKTKKSKHHIKSSTEDATSITEAVPHATTIGIDHTSGSGPHGHIPGHSITAPPNGVPTGMLPPGMLPPGMLPPGMLPPETASFSGHSGIYTGKPVTGKNDKIVTVYEPCTSTASQFTVTIYTKEPIATGIAGHFSQHNVVPHAPSTPDAASGKDSLTPPPPAMSWFYDHHLGMVLGYPPPAKKHGHKHSHGRKATRDVAIPVSQLVVETWGFQDAAVFDSATSEMTSLHTRSSESWSMPGGKSVAKGLKFIRSLVSRSSKHEHHHGGHSKKDRNEALYNSNTWGADKNEDGNTVIVVSHHKREHAESQIANTWHSSGIKVVEKGSKYIRSLVSRSPKHKPHGGYSKEERKNIKYDATAWGVDGNKAHNGDTVVVVSHRKRDKAQSFRA